MHTPLIDAYWSRIVHHYSPDNDLASTLWSDLRQAYGHPARHYHNLAHLQDMFELIQSDNIDDDSIVLATFYHDIVYKAGRKDNETKSASLARQACQSIGVPHVICEVVGEMILATRNHQAQKSNLRCAYFLDIDMAILGAPADRFQNYCTGVRKEFHSLPSAIYNAGRKKFLRSLLARERIFQTETIHKKFEHIAQQNIQQELNNL